MKIHNLKCERQFFTLIRNGIKKFEVRKNDRGFAVGDIVTLEEVVSGEYTGQQLPPMEIEYVMPGGDYGLQSEYCIFSWRWLIRPIPRIPEINDSNITLGKSVVESMRELLAKLKIREDLLRLEELPSTDEFEKGPGTFEKESL